MKADNQDFTQKMNVASTLILELYRVLMGAFLMAFVPQKCDDHVCSIMENINRSGILSHITVSSNGLTLFAFLILYIILDICQNK